PFSLFLLFRFGFLNWVRCKPVGPRRGEGEDGSRSLCASSTHARNPAMGPNIRICTKGTEMREHVILFCLLGLVLTATIILVIAPGAVTWALALIERVAPPGEGWSSRR